MKTIKIFAYALAITSGFVFTSCGSDDSDGGLPPIGGYDSSDEVASADLVAKWSFDGDGKESISGAMPATSSGVSYVASDRGQALNLTEGFLKYNAITNLSSTLSSFTISTWVKATNNGASGSVFLSLARPNEWAGNINFLAETGWAQATSDSLTVKGQIVSNNALAWQDTRNAIKMDQGMIDANNNGQTPQHVANANKIGGQWAHCVLVWDGASRMFTVYVNGQRISNPAWELRGNAESPAFAFTTPTYPVIGAFATFANGTSTDGWDKGMTGQLDEMRVYKKALIQADISALYQLESAGR